MKPLTPRVKLLITIAIGVLLGRIIKNYKVAFAVTLIMAFLITVNWKNKKQ